MPLIRIDALDDSRVADYCNLKDRELARDGGKFLAEGEHLVRRLLASRFQTASIFLAERLAAEIAPLVPPDVPIYVTTQAVMNSVIGHGFHAGVIACGLRGPSPTLDAVLPPPSPADEVNAPDSPSRLLCRLTLLVLPEIANVQNLGGLIRLAAAFGVNAVLLGEKCHDPFWRQSVRVSMGAVFRLPLVRSDDIRRDIARLKNEWRFELAATVLNTDAQPLAHAQRGPRLALLFGNEAQGLDRELVDACDRRVTIPMRLGTDSLNVAVSAGIFLYHFTQGAGNECEIQKASTSN